MTIQTRAATAADYPVLLDMNNAAVPSVNLLDADAFATLVAKSHRTVVVFDDSAPGAVLGFALVLTPGADYESENYLWFSARSDNFLYLDRIVIDENSRSLGLGQVLYEDVFADAKAISADNVFCEVNLEPPNPRSLAFHQRLGFEQLDTQSTKGGSVVVTLLGRPV